MNSKIFVGLAALTLSSGCLAQAAHYEFRQAAKGVVAQAAAPVPNALPSNCKKTASNQVWCMGASLADSGATTCGYPVGYSGAYYAATAEVAGLFGKGFESAIDCATNYVIGSDPTMIRAWTGTYVTGHSLCGNTTSAMANRWALAGGNGRGEAVVRCTNKE